MELCNVWVEGWDIVICYLFCAKFFTSPTNVKWLSCSIQQGCCQRVYFTFVHLNGYCNHPDLQLHHSVKLFSLYQIGTLTIIYEMIQAFLMLLYNLSDLIMCSMNKVYYSAFVYYFMHCFYINLIQVLTSTLYTDTPLSLLCVHSWWVM